MSHQGVVKRLLHRGLEKLSPVSREWDIKIISQSSLHPMFFQSVCLLRFTRMVSWQVHPSPTPGCVSCLRTVMLGRPSASPNEQVPKHDISPCSIRLRHKFLLSGEHRSKVIGRIRLQSDYDEVSCCFGGQERSSRAARQALGVAVVS